MSYQRVLVRLCSLPVLRGPGHTFLRRRVWRVERGLAAGLRIRFPQNRDYLAGTSELPVQQEIGRNLQPGGVFYDVGANVGFFSLMAARLVGAAGQVCAFEPNPHNTAALRDNAGLNGMANVRVFEVAVGQNSRTEELLRTAWDGGGALSSSAVSPADPVDQVVVQVVSLDSFIPDAHLPPPTFVKVDVEGAELAVLEGMRETVLRWRPVLLYEIDDGTEERFNRRWAELDDYVTRLGYRVRHLDNSYPGLNWHVGHSVAEPEATGA